jgi:Zn-dependent protease with chaperone function
MPTYRTTAYRYPYEGVIFAGTILLVLAVIALTATATLCLSAVFIVIMVAWAYFRNQAHHKELMQRAYLVTAQSAPDLHTLARGCYNRLQPGSIQIYVTPHPEMNAYTFGLGNPKVVVLYSTLFNSMDADEIRFILGHELGHVSLGHTWLNTLLGGMAGIPAPYGAAFLLTAAFLWWNRSCEYSADRAGLLACSQPAKAISALVKLAAGPGRHSSAEMSRIYKMVEAEDEELGNVLGEVLSTHPMIVRRIHELQRYAATPAYQRLQALVNQNG